MEPLHRHQLAWPTPAGWCAVLDRAWDGQARECLAHWAGQGLPLVVTRQPPPDGAASLALGLPAPGRWGRRRLALQVPRTEVSRFGEFPLLAELQTLVPLVHGLDAAGAPARVFGSHGWQAITGLDHVRPGSDLDLSVPVRDVAHADAVAEVLQSQGTMAPALDGELAFPGGAAVSWREWRAWRAGHTRSILVKRLAGVALHHDVRWCGPLEEATA